MLKVSKASPARKLLKSFLFGFIALPAGIFAAGILTVWIFYMFLTPSAAEVLGHKFPASSKIYSRDGTMLYEIFGEVKRDPVSLESIPKQLQQATIAIEDKDFYQHGALSYKDIVRAAWVDYKNQDTRQGASTLTQQYVKNAILSRDKSFYRKLVEAVVAHKIESHTSKDQVLTLYLNTIPYGRNSYGVAAASREYYGKTLNQLTLAEVAYLVAFPQAPSFYEPLGPNREALDTRKNLVLTDMLEEGYITQNEYKAASEEQVNFIARQNNIIAPYFVFWVEQQLSQKYGQGALKTEGLRIYTTLDLKLQQMAESVVKEYAEKNSKEYNAYNASLVAMDPKTGEVLAMVGGKDYFGSPEPSGCRAGRNCLFEPNVNTAVSARQPGSSFKPITYLTAFGPEFKLSPASAIYDSPVTYGGTYSPRNYDGGFRGKISIRRALAGSLNIPAVKTLNSVGVDSVVNMAHSLGITAPLKNCGLSLTLGSCEVKLVDHVTAFSTIANRGVFQGTCGVLKAINTEGQEVEKCPALGKRVADAQAVYELTNIMIDNDARTYIFGKKTPLAFEGRQVAAKTGTTDDWKDGWTLGFTPSLAAGVWVGNNDGTLMKRNADGIFVAAPMWRAFMDQALSGSEPENFEKPEGVKELQLKDIPSSLRSRYTFTKKTELFADYAVPKVENKPAPDLEKKTTTATAQATPLPQVRINVQKPAAFSTISIYPYSVAVEVSDAKQVAHMELYLDGKFVQTLKTAPFVFSAEEAPTPGLHTLMVIATDEAGRTSNDTVSVNFLIDTGR